MRQNIQNLRSQKSQKEERQKHLKIRKWQKAAARAAIKAQLLEDKLKALIRDNRVSNRDLLIALKEALESERVISVVAQLRGESLDSEDQEEEEDHKNWVK